MAVFLVYRSLVIPVVTKHTGSKQLSNTGISVWNIASFMTGNKNKDHYDIVHFKILHNIVVTRKEVYTNLDFLMIL